MNLILPTPVPSIQNDMFKPYDEPDVICLGNVKNWDYNDNITVGPRIEDQGPSENEKSQSRSGIDPSIKKLGSGSDPRVLNMLLRD